jgi:aminoglycoside phosphotransferase (APT) family kinase protein
MSPSPPPLTDSGTPPAEFEIDVELARSLLRVQHPDLADLAIEPVAFGWDNAVLRLGEDLALRLPRRNIGAVLISREQRWLPFLKDRLPLAVPAPVRIGAAQDAYPWPWSIVPWIEGETADLASPDADQGETLAGFFEALHRPAPEDAPTNAYRGVPLAERAGVFDQRIVSVAARGEPLEAAALATWADALAAPNDAAPTWIQGDPHPRNVLVREGRIVAMIDWGDMARGDRASDLAGIWMLLPDRRARERAIAGLPSVSGATWRRAKGWAVLYVAMLLDAGLADDPRMAAIARATLARLREGP